MQHVSQLPGASALRGDWAWVMILAAIFIIIIMIGTIALGSALVTTFTAVFFFGWMLIIGGVLEALHVFGRQKMWAVFSSIYCRGRSTSSWAG